MIPDIAGKNILVTGGAGFIGSHTVDALVGRKANVTVVDDLSTGRRENLNPKAAFVPLNIADARIDDVMDDVKPDYVFHLAFFVRVPQSTQNPALDLDAVAGTIRILQKVKQQRRLKKLIFASSGFVYGNNPNVPVKENEPADPVSAYVVSKTAVENYLRFYKRTFGISHVTLRYTAIYGPRQVTGAMADYIRQLSHGRQAEMWGGGVKSRDYVYVEDVVDANLRALAVPDDHPDPVYNVGTSRELSLIDLYREIAGLLGVKPEPIHHPDRPGEQQRLWLDGTKISRELKWTAKVSMQEGLRRTVDHWRARNFEL